MNLIIQPAKKSDLEEITQLLLDNQLPTNDIIEDTVHLFVGLTDNEIAGVIGLEIYQPVGLLRSLAVKDSYKNQKIGAKLVNQLFDICISEKIEDLYLLTPPRKDTF